jgi:hypothetical protein
MGGFESAISVVLDPTVKYHSYEVYDLTWTEKNGREQYLVGSLFGANSS